MQVFIIGTPLETAIALDKGRLNKQIIECGQILGALNGAKAWSNHPCVLQYRGNEKWLEFYMRCLQSFYDYVRYGRNGDKHDMQVYDHTCKLCTPDWHDQRYYDNMKARLYTKNPQHYAQFAEYGESQENWYWSQEQGEWRKYVNGKRIK